MSIWPRPKPPVPPDPPPPLPEMHVVLYDGARVVEGTLISGEVEGEDGLWSAEGIPLSYFMLSFTLPRDVRYGATKVRLHLEATGFDDYDEVVFAVPDFNVNMHRSKPLARSGIVTISNHTWRDDDGIFFPLGTTLFWILSGWHGNDRDRIRQNWAFLQQHGYDYYRMLGEVDWENEEIDPSWPNYAQELGDVVDCAYDDYALRTQITCVGGGVSDPLGLARVVRDVVAAGRQHKVLMLESVNETNLDADAAVEMAKILVPIGIPVGVGYGNAGGATVRDLGDKAGASVDYYHTERDGDEARKVRQGWNFKDFRRASCCNEPPGPASSVGQLDDPFKIAALRTLSVICGAGPFCLHTGTGVYGRPMTGEWGTRYANLWEIPNADTLFSTVRQACRGLATDVGSWTKFNDGWTPPNPVAPVYISAGTVNKHYGARDYATGRFVSMPLGCVGPVTFAAYERCHLVVRHLITNDVIAERDLEVREQLQVNDQWAYLLTGTTR